LKGPIKRINCGTIFSGEEQNFQKNWFRVPKFLAKILFPRNKIPVTGAPMFFDRKWII